MALPTTLDDYTHTGCGTVPDVRHEFYQETRRDIIDAPDFFPCGYHISVIPFGNATPVPSGAHNYRPRAFR